MFAMFAKNFSRRGQIITLLCVTLAVATLGLACGRSESKAKAKDADNKREAGTVESAPPVAVTTARAEMREVPTYFETTGSLIADETSDVATQASGQVVSTPVGVGAFVRQGDVLARLNDKDARLRLQQANAGVGQAVAGVRQAEARLASAASTRASTEQQYESEQRQFRAGTSTLFLVLQRQTELLAARGRELQAQTDLNKSISEFQRATGNTLEANHVAVHAGDGNVRELEMRPALDSQQTVDNLTTPQTATSPADSFNSRSPNDE